MQKDYMFYCPTRVLFGCGKIKELSDYINTSEDGFNATKAMIVISNGKSVKETGTLSKVKEQLKNSNITYVVFDKVGANPVKAVVEEGARFAKENGCDCIVAVGGGSVMDAAKVMAMYANQPGDLWDYVYGSTGKMMPLVNPTIPVIAVTTTAGTGSEVDAWGVVTNPETNEKIGCGGQDSLFPVIAVVDPELMVTVPPKFTAYQGFDTLFHSTEGFIAKTCNRMAEMVEKTAIENVGKYLARAVKDGTDIEAREGMAFANTLSGYSMVVSSCTSEHSMEHAMSAFHPNLPHGAGLIMISVEYYRWFIEKGACPERFVEMAKLLGKKDAEKPEDFIDALIKLQKDCGVYDLKMSDYGITIDECEKFAENARDTMGGLFLCDRVPMYVKDCAEIYRKAFK